MSSNEKKSSGQFNDRLNKQTTKSKTINGIRAIKVVEILQNEIATIRSLKEWANKTKYSMSTLRRIVRASYGKTPGEILKEVKFEKVVQIIKQDPDAVVYCIALDAGFTSESALRMFLRRQYDTNIRTLRKKVLSGELQMELEWLKGSD